MIHYQDDTITLHHGQALDVLRVFPDRSVGCCVTSPPYFGLRCYLPDSHPDKSAEIGAEASPAEYVANLRAVFSEVRRVLADDGTLWLNLADSYSGGHRVSYDTQDGNTRNQGFNVTRPHSGLPGKNLLGIAWRVAFALQEDGWILRSAVTWVKGNPLPESVTDRLSCRTEMVFLFSKSRTYWFDLDPIREPVRHNTRTGHTFGGAKKAVALTTSSAARRTGGTYVPTGVGRNPGDVWQISTVPFPGAHFASFPPELPRRCITAGCKPGAIVLDPFSGSGTTGMVAVKRGHPYIGIDLSVAYLDLSLRTRLANM